MVLTRSAALKQWEAELFSALKKVEELAQLKTNVVKLQMEFNRRNQTDYLREELKDLIDFKQELIEPLEEEIASIL
jgi:hypothetical protein